MIDLQQLLQDQFDAAGYAGYVYDTTPRPPLREGDNAGARGLVARQNGT